MNACCARAQVARLSRRTLLMPDLPCETAWLHDDVSKADAVMKRMLCVAPTFWKHPDRCGTAL